MRFLGFILLKCKVTIIKIFRVCHPILQLIMGYLGFDPWPFRVGNTLGVGCCQNKCSLEKELGVVYWFYP